MPRSLLYACVASALTLTTSIQPASAGSYDMAANTALETGSALKRTANDDYSAKSVSPEHQAINSLDAATAPLTNKEYDQAYKDFSKAFKLKDHGNEESAPKAIINTINQISLAVMEFIISL